MNNKTFILSTGCLQHNNAECEMRYHAAGFKSQAAQDENKYLFSFRYGDGRAIVWTKDGWVYLEELTESIKQGDQQ